MFHVPEKDRVKNLPFNELNSTKDFGNNGIFRFNLSNSVVAWCQASDGEGWEHLSVHIVDEKLKPANRKDKEGYKYSQQRTATWSEMCRIKDMFWDEDDCVVQYHPPKSEYINNHKFTLHLWKQVGLQFPMPDKFLVGVPDEDL